jgi:hypothetical protein
MVPVSLLPDGKRDQEKWNETQESRNRRRFGLGCPEKPRGKRRVSFSTWHTISVDRAPPTVKGAVFSCRAKWYDLPQTFQLNFVARLDFFFFEISLAPSVRLVSSVCVLVRR